MATPELLSAIQTAANDAITRNTVIQTVVLPLAAVKERYGFAAFDSYFPPAGDTTLMYIPHWNINLLEPGSAVLSHTGGVGRIEVYPLREEAEGAAADPLGRSSKAYKDKLELRFRVYAEEALPPPPHAAMELLEMGLPDIADVALLHPKVEKKPKPAAAASPAPAGGDGGAAAVAAAPAPKAAKKEKAAMVTSTPAAVAVPVAAAAPVSNFAGVVAAGSPRDSSPLAIDDAAELAHHGGEGQIITPWEVEAEEGIDYEKLIRDFGCSRITEDIIARVERLTNRRAHRFLRRGLFFSHRDLTELLDAYESGQPFYLYTGGWERV